MGKSGKKISRIPHVARHVVRRMSMYAHKTENSPSGYIAPLPYLLILTIMRLKRRHYPISLPLFLLGALFACITPAAAFNVGCGGSISRTDVDPIVELSRREVISISIAAAVLNPTKSKAIESTTFVTGTATLQTGISKDSIGTGAALYVTCRPNSPDNVPKAILDGSRGKPPPVLAARFSDPQFPFQFSLTSDNLTPEGASAVEGDPDKVWWSKEDLIVSARLDSDGVAATRDPNDLVGRGYYSSKTQDASMIELQGRGLFGKAVTSKK